jgi:anti-anti-sigma factor
MARSGVFRIEGEYDLATAGAIGAELMNIAISTTGDLAVDCLQMTFIDSSGINELVAVHRILARQGRRLVLVDVQMQCRRVFEVCGLQELIRQHDPVGRDPV